MLALRHADGSEQVLVLTDLLTGRNYGIEEAELTEPVREWLTRTTAKRRAQAQAAAAQEAEERRAAEE
jgi:gas vesicle GvpC-like protein